MRKQTHWANIAEVGTSLGIAVLLAAYKVGGKALFKIFLAPVVAYFFLFNRQARQASKDYLRKLGCCFPEQKIKLSLLTSFRHFWQFGLALIDKLAIWMGSIDYREVDIHGHQLIDELKSKQQGAILLVSHLGNFEISRALARYYHSMKITVLLHTRHAANFNQFLRRYDNSAQVELLQVDDINPATAMALYRKVSRGDLIAISADRVPVNNPANSAAVSFLGQMAPFPIGAYLLASILEVPVYSLFCIKESGKYNIYFEQLADSVKVERNNRHQAFQMLAQAYADRLQHYCGKAPLQWYNFYQFWDQASNSVGDSLPGAKAVQKGRSSE